MRFAEVELWVDRKKEKKKKKKEIRKEKKKKRSFNHVFEWMKYICNINLNLISSFIGPANSFACPFIRVGYME